jgi:hypothetical protein
MPASIHARLDDETLKVRDQLRSAQGWSDTEIIRRGIRALAPFAVDKRRRKFAGEGEYDSGIPDLSTNPKYLEGFGE